MQVHHDEAPFDNLSPATRQKMLDEVEQAMQNRGDQALPRDFETVLEDE